MEPQEVLPVQYALPQNDAWGRIRKVFALLSIIFGAANAALAGLMIYVTSTQMNIGFPGGRQLAIWFAIGYMAGGAAAAIGGMIFMRNRGRFLLAAGMVTLLGTDLIQDGVAVFSYLHAGRGIGTSWWALASVTLLYLLLTSVFPVAVLMVLWQMKKQS
jgi:hypothetical protein